MAFKGSQTKNKPVKEGLKRGGGFYSYRLKFWLFYGYRLIFFQLRITKKLKTNFFCFKELNINKPAFVASSKQN